ncbi:MAG: cytidine deaminase [Mycoplasmataceae bacterium]|nr:cytidine deaminase [Mycoplasmataceae bacterium]
MLKKLEKISSKSYSPYSNFKVAAILEHENGELYHGANIENIAFPSSICAERVAITSALMQGVELKKIIKIHIYSPNADFVLAPCGGCRQVMVEHLLIETDVCMYSNSGDTTTLKLSELVPLPIMPKSFLGKS